MKRKVTRIIYTALMAIAVSSNAQEAQTFGGHSLYRTWSLGLHGGILSPVVFIGGSNDFTNWEGNLGYGISISKQLSPSFLLKANVLRGKVSATNLDAPLAVQDGYRAYSTEIGYATDVRGELGVGTINF
ncbi:MAG: OmpA family protein, partial [Pedobacter sp.]